MPKMKWSEFKKGLDLALQGKSTYAFGAFGWPMNAANKKRALNNKGNSGDKGIKAGIDKADSNTFAFDCVCLPKAILWGWNANNKANYGGAVYNSNGVPDVNSDIMTSKAHMNEYSTDISKIKVGAFLGMAGHMGIYIGNGKVVECTPKWTGDVLVSNLSDRKWLRWGMSKYIDYSELDKPKPEPTPPPKPDVLDIGDKVSFSGYAFTQANGGKQGKVNHKGTKGVISAIVKGAARPYHVANDKGSGIGWVTASQVGASDPIKPNPSIKVGSKVKINKGAYYQGAAKGKKVSTLALLRTHTVDRIDGANARLQPINSWVALKDLKAV